MAFRSGSVTGRGVIYSRRRGRGLAFNPAFHNKPSIIYEETEEESDHEMTEPPLNQKKPDISKTIGLFPYLQRYLANLKELHSKINPILLDLLKDKPRLTFEEDEILLLFEEDVIMLL